MSGSVETEAPRPRPLSGGLWTLFSWLRRDERSSTESLSSVGSDRTAASFAFLAPALYPSTAPAHLPQVPPTDSYKKRVRDRNLRRQQERDLTLHRKYGLYGLGYDAHTLPVTAAFARERDRRAASESPREHVPGKRRAPPPPTRSVPSASLTRRRARKRPAPPPPVDLPHTTERNNHKELSSISEVPMSRSPHHDARPLENRDTTADDTIGCKPEKYSKKDARAKETKDVKIRHEKSFLKQIFDSRKRNSAIETSSIKLLPNISELDKQAAEMIEKYRLKEVGHSQADDNTSKHDSSGSSTPQMEAWICTRCLRKYNATVITCNYCLPLNKSSDSYRHSKLPNHSTQTHSVPGSSRSKPEDKEKLKEMLKEMKDSLPKRSKNDNIAPNKPKSSNANEEYPKNVEAPTLRIGSSIAMEDKHHVAETSKTNRLDKDVSSSQLSDITKEEIEKNDISKIVSRIILDKEIPPSKMASRDANQINLSPVSKSGSGASTSKSIAIEKEKELTTINSVFITQPVVLVHTKESNVVSNNVVLNKELMKNSTGKSRIDIVNDNINKEEKMNKNSETESLTNKAKTKNDLSTPLKISSLLNPIYIPKTTTSVNTQTSAQQVDVKTKKNTDPIALPEVHNKTVEPVAIEATSSDSQIKENTQLSEPKVQNKNENPVPINNSIITDVIAEGKKVDVKANTDNVVTAQPLSVGEPSTSNETRVDQHTRRRELIHQLERSIAKGDEKAAAEAAVKLAQLRLSCSVLSFSSQIVAEPSTSSAPQETKSKTNVSSCCNATKIKVDEVFKKPAKGKADKVDQKHKILNKNGNDREVLSNKKITIVTSVTEKKIPQEPANGKSKNEVKNDNQKIMQNEASTSTGITNKENDNVPILVWVEDKEATRGPVQLHVRRNAAMGELRRQAEQSLGLAAGLQRWIVGRSLCSDDNTPLVTLAGAELTAPFYLCLVESESKESAKPNIDLNVNDDAGNVYNELVKLEHQPIVTNAEVFECGVCIEECPPGRGVVLRECVHTFCKECLSDVVRHSEDPIVACPAMGCRGVLQEREIRGLVTPEDYEKWLARGLAAAESGTRNAFHCRTRDCTGWALCEPGVRRFPCPVCKRTNCVPCQAIHEKETCEQHRAKLQQQSANSAGSTSNTDEGTRAFLDTLISRGEAVECPECSAIITKKWGCDWVKCSACKTEICWVTKGRRWGPAGRGDTSAGCRCGVDGKRCHPSCGYCH